MRIASSTSSRRETSAREGSNGRGRAAGRGGSSARPAASGSRTSTIGERSNKRGCLNLSSQALGTNQNPAITQRLQIDLPQYSRPQPRRVPVSHPSTLESMVPQAPQDAAPGASNSPPNAIAGESTAAATS
ncbi:hypothetical protein ACP70R_028291 [Stipagrostis hirtigluma subsp. patula]